MRIVTHLAAVVAANLLILLVGISTSQAFTCLNRDSLNDIASVTNTELVHEFVGADGEDAIKTLNLFTAPTLMVTGDELLLWRGRSSSVASVMARRGSGYCLVANVMLSAWQVDRIAAVVLGE